MQFEQDEPHPSAVETAATNSATYVKCMLERIQKRWLP